MTAAETVIAAAPATVGRTFDPAGPLPRGTTVLEASAGTGKTYAIVGLAARFVAEGVAEIGDLLLVTFGRHATRELRDRARARFTTVAAALADPRAAAAHDDAVVRVLAAGAPAEVALRRRRLRRALADFDAGTITTTHGFCQRMLDGLGIWAEREPDARLVEDVLELIDEVTDDEYLRRYGRWDGPPPLSRDDAGAVARAAVVDRQARLVPDAEAGSAPDSAAAHRVGFATAVRAEVQRRKRLLGIRDFDDLLVLLRDALADPVHGAAAAARIRDRYRVVLVDEFQDSDPVQWEILRRAFHGHVPLVLVGDPKQAIYAFRGAEVLSYLDAVQVAGAHLELDTNRRSDAGLVRALSHIYGGAALGHPAIVVSDVAAVHPGSRLSGAIPVRLRVLPRAGLGPRNKSGFPAVGRVRDGVAADLAADLVRLLADPPLLHDEAGSRPLGPGDIAVLVRTRNQLATVRAALDRVGLASVLAGGSSVFGTTSAVAWLHLLQALEQPHRGDRVRLAALGPLLGWTVSELDVRGPDAVAEIGSRLREYAALLLGSGFAAMFERLAEQARLAERLLALDGGERELTDLRHLAQLLDRVMVDDHRGPTELVRWLSDRIAEPATGGPADRSRRLDRDAAAIQLATVHASKGLEFPVVYLPFGWDTGRNPYPATLLLHDERGDRLLDVGDESAPGYRERRRRHEAEQAGEELRLLYVGLTRARCQVVIWWAPAFTTAESPLHRLILGRAPGSATVPGRARVPADAAVGADLDAWAEPVADVLAVEQVRDAPPDHGRRRTATADLEPLEVARFRRRLDLDWRRTSYSALTVDRHAAPAGGPGGAGVRSEAEDPGRDDEPADDASTPVGADTVRAGALASPMSDLPAGPLFGVLVHEVLETVDTGAADLRAEVRRRCTASIESRLAEVDPDLLTDALGHVLATPLPDGVTLAAIAPRDRLTELDFELPLAGGADPVAAAATAPEIAALLRRHLATDDPLIEYPDRLAELAADPLRGYLTGSIDAVLRLPGPRFAIVDYKTNRLAAGPLTVDHYRPDRMAAEMVRADYPLQALLYSVALHRYLRWRLPGYHPHAHLAGVRYLFVRGMAGPATPAGCGVFDWRPSPELIVALSDRLAGGSA
ncbi:UvrD-helicase domain-containing protein [Skermania piniformis]|uniref:UvrD-helicase domain-containing protein n=1 Tax=Skermania pinensis TaxID=39122 RepID=UPI000B2ACC7A|nr:UvrD-helicase domain-containing protein [Skermania piniformis]